MALLQGFCPRTISSSGRTHVVHFCTGLESSICKNNIITHAREPTCDVFHFGLAIIVPRKAEGVAHLD